MGEVTDTFNAIWTRVQADPLWTALPADGGLLHGGTLYTFNGVGVLKRLQVVPAVCPVLALAPAPEGHHWRPAKRRRGEGLEPRAAFLAEMATAGNDSRMIVALAEAFQAFVEAQMTKDNFGVPLLSDIEWSKLAYAPGYERAGEDKHLTGNIEMWKWTGTMTCHYRIV